MKSWTPNQLVAYNLARARQLRGWTQEQAASELAKYQDGVEWSKVTWSAAERSIDGKRVRQFTADDLLALSQAFALPLTWWFLPPGSEEDVTIAGLEEVYPDGSRTQFSQDRMAFLLFHRPPEVVQRLERTGLDRLAKELAAAAPSADDLRDMAHALYRAWDLIRGAINVVESEEEVDLSAYLDDLYRNVVEASNEDTPTHGPKKAKPRTRRAG